MAQAPESDAAESEQSAGPKPDWSWLVRLRFLTTADFPPFNYYDEEGTLTGLNVDLARGICRELDIECEISAVEWNDLIPALQNDRGDAAIAAIAITAERLANLDFTDVYLQIPARFAVRRDSNLNDVTPEMLAEKKIAVVKGTAHEAYLRTFFKESEIVTFDEHKAAREALRAGKVDLLFADAISLIFWLNGSLSQGCCQFLGGGFMETKYFGEGLAIAVKRGNTRMRDVLNYALARMRTTGRFQELLLRYFPLRLY